MFENLEIMRMAQALSSHSGARLALVARNVANADTPGYRALDLPDFAQTYEGHAGSGALRTTRSGHFAGAIEDDQPAPRQTVGSASPNGNTVSIDSEMVTAIKVRQDNDMALSIYRTASEILRASLGRGR